MKFSVFFTLTLAANYMEIPSLLDACITHFALMATDKSIPQLLRNMNIPPLESDSALDEQNSESDLTNKVVECRMVRRSMCL